MPWHISKRGEQFCVVKDGDGSTVACHSSEEKAKKHLAALYANEPSAALHELPLLYRVLRRR